jgi:Xaa-Pro dipeptidase
MEKSSRTAVLLSSQAWFAWLTAGGRDHVSMGGDQGVAWAIVTAEEAYLLSPNIERQRLIDEEAGSFPFEFVEYPWHQVEERDRIVGELCDLSRALSDSDVLGLPRLGPDFLELRRILIPEEIKRYRALGKHAAEAVELACDEANQGDTELEVAGRVSFECTRRDILPLVVLVAADDRIAAYRHPIPTSNKIGTTMLVALTGRKHGLHASLTRMVSFAPLDDDLARRHDAVTRLDAQLMIDSAPGASLGSIMSSLIERYENVGWREEWRLHHQGGLTGYAGREVFATPENDYELKSSQALAWNPSITRVKSEDTIVIVDGDFEVLTDSGQWPQVSVPTTSREALRPAIKVKGDS